MSSFTRTINPSSIPPVPSGPLTGFSIYDEYVTAAQAQLIASWVTVALCGVALSQAFNYFKNYPNDALYLKLLAWTLSILNIVHTVFVCMAEYTYMISDNHCQVVPDLVINWRILVTVQTHVTLAAIVLLYFTNMCFKMLAGSRMQKPLLVSLLTLISLHFGFGTATTVELARMNFLLDFEYLKNMFVIPMTVTQVAADIAIAISVCYSLPRPSAQTFRGSREAVQMLIVYALSRGILTSIAAVVELVGLIFDSRSLWFGSADYIIAGLYVNSFLASLNCRNEVRRRMVGIVNVESQLVSSANLRTRNQSVHVHRASEGSSITQSAAVVKTM